MSKWMCVFVALWTALPLSGCAICNAPDDDAYGAYGGVFERSDRSGGRVFSAFQPAGIVEDAVITEVEMLPPGESWEMDSEVLPLQSADGSDEVFEPEMSPNAELRSVLVR